MNLSHRLSTYFHHWSHSRRPRRQIRSGVDCCAVIVLVATLVTPTRSQVELVGLHHLFRSIA